MEFGVPGALADPTLTVVNRSGTVTDENDNWGDYADQAELVTAMEQAQAFALLPGTTDAAMIVTVEPGLYTVVVSGQNGGTGVGLVEVYELPSASAQSAAREETL